MLLYTLPGQHIDSAQQHLRWTPHFGRSVQWTPLVGTTVPCLADLEVSAVHIYLCVHIRDDIFNFLHAGMKPSPLAYRTNTQ
jgi:hypothetical protein